jgi:hypothetical protein
MVISNPSTICTGILSALHFVECIIILSSTVCRRFLAVTHGVIQNQGFDDILAQKFTHPTAKPSKPTWPTSQKKLKNVGFHFDLSDITKTIPDTRPGAAKGATRKTNVFKWQAASEAEQKSIKD